MALFQSLFAYADNLSVSMWSSRNPLLWMVAGERDSYWVKATKIAIGVLIHVPVAVNATVI